MLDPSIGWRLGFLIGPVIGLCIWNVRRHLPESPRWLIIHGREREAEESIAYIEHEVESVRPAARAGRREPGDRDPPEPPVNFLHLAKVLFAQYTVAVHPRARR